MPGQVHSPLGPGPQGGDLPGLGIGSGELGGGEQSSWSTGEGVPGLPWELLGWEVFLEE